MARLENRLIAVTGPRKAEELSRMIEKFGGQALIRPAQGTVFLDDSFIENQLRALIHQPADWIVLTTGVGTEALMTTAASLGLADELLGALRRMRIAARGYKTVNALKKLGLVPEVRDYDGTTAGLLDELSAHDLRGKRIALQLYGDPAPRVTMALTARGAKCEELLPYRHVPPEGNVARRLVDEIAAYALDAVAFTSTVQVRYVMSTALRLGKLQEVLTAFETGVLAVAVGKVTAETLYEEGVQRVLYPEEERMGSMVVAMSRYFGGGGGLTPEEEASSKAVTGECAAAGSEERKAELRIGGE